MIQYQHRQFAKTLMIILSLGTIICLILATQQSHRYISLGVALLLFICGIIFSRLSIEVTDEDLRWKFGSGLIQKTVKLSEIEAVEITRTTLIEGWGIHLTRRGWLYNISGWKAVVIKLKQNQQFLLGTDEPEKLVSAIQQQLNYI